MQRPAVGLDHSLRRAGRPRGEEDVRHVRLRRTAERRRSSSGGSPRRRDGTGTASQPTVPSDAGPPQTTTVVADAGSREPDDAQQADVVGVEELAHGHEAARPAAAQQVSRLGALEPGVDGDERRPRPGSGRGRRRSIRRSWGPKWPPGRPARRRRRRGRPRTPARCRATRRRRACRPPSTTAGPVAEALGGVAAQGGNGPRRPGTTVMDGRGPPTFIRGGQVPTHDLAHGLVGQANNSST